MKVIARLPALEATASVTAPPAAPEPVSDSIPVSLVSPAEPETPTVSAAALPQRPPAIARVQFPLRSVLTLALLAAVTWTAAWWNDRQRADADRVLQASLEPRPQQRPERLARELPTDGAAPKIAKP